MPKAVILFTLALVACVLVSAPAADDLDRQLQTIWARMVSHLKGGNEEKALELIHPVMREQYRVMFQALNGRLPQIVSTQTDFRPVSIGSDSANYELTTRESGVTYSYEVTFLRDGERWFILDF